MERLLRQFRAQGSDGGAYAVRVYQQVAGALPLADGAASSAGRQRFRTGTGQVLTPEGEGRYRIVGTGVLLCAEEHAVTGRFDAPEPV